MEHNTALSPSILLFQLLCDLIQKAIWIENPRQPHPLIPAIGRVNLDFQDFSQIRSNHRDEGLHSLLIGRPGHLPQKEQRR